MNENERLFKQTQELLYQDIEEAEKLLIELRKDETPEKSYLVCELLIEFGDITGEVKYYNEAIERLNILDESDFPRVPFYLGTAYMRKYDVLEEKPNLIDSKNLLYSSKVELKKFISNNPDEDLHNAYVNLGSVYRKIGRTIEAHKIFSQIYEKTGSEYGLFNEACALVFHSEFEDNPHLYIKKAYNYFKIIRDDPNLKRNFRENSENMIDYLLEEYGEEFLEDGFEGDEIVEIPVDNDSESFMIKYSWENKLSLNLCEFCQSCPKYVEDSLAIEKMIYSAPEDGKETSFSKLSSYLNQIKMDYISARTLLVLSKNEEIDLDIITRHVFIADTDYPEANDIRVQFLKDSFKNFFNILDKIAFFIKDYLGFEDKYDKINFRTLWNNPEIKKHLIERSNPGLTALYDIYLDVEYGHEKEHLRKTRNALTHKYLKITTEKLDITDKTVEELSNETLEIAHIVKNAIIYLMRFVKINEDCKEEEMGIEFMPIEEVEF